VCLFSLFWDFFFSWFGLVFVGLWCLFRCVILGFFSFGVCVSFFPFPLSFFVPFDETLRMRFQFLGLLPHLCSQVHLFFSV